MRAQYAGSVVCPVSFTNITPVTKGRPIDPGQSLAFEAYWIIVPCRLILRDGGLVAEGGRKVL